MTSKRSLLYEGYADSYEEAHRRRPTSFAGPLLTALNAYYYPANPAKRESFIERILDCLGSDSPRELAKRIACYHLPGSNEADNEKFRMSTPLILDGFEPSKEINGCWRAEFHREYVCIVLFVPIDIILVPDENKTTVTIRNSGTRKDWTCTADSSDCGALVDVLYIEALECIENEFNNIAGHFRRWSELHSIQEEFEPKLFADFFGGCLPWTYFEQALGPDNRPAFPDPHSSGFTSTEARAASECAARFIRALTAPGAASALLGHWPDDCVACYVQNGHSIYLSNIGKRQSDRDETPLKYLALYADTHSWPKAGCIGSVQFLPWSSDGVLTKQPSRANHRLSRFIGRIHDVGVARLAALKSMKKMKEFNNALREVEFELQTISTAHARTTTLKELEVRIEAAAHAVGESVYHRSLRASYYLGQLRRIAGDLSIVGIAGFQDYRQFVSRNLYQSIENIVTIGRRYQAVLEQLNTKHHAANAVNLLRIQQIADMAASVIVIYYLLSIPGKVAEYLPEVGIGHPWTTYLVIVALGLGAIAYWLLSLRIYRIANEMNRAQPGKTTVMIWAARLFALPHLLWDMPRNLRLTKAPREPESIRPSPE